MSMYDRDWYKEEHARKQGRRPAHELRGRGHVTLDDFLKAERAKENLRGGRATAAIYADKRVAGKHKAFSFKLLFSLVAFVICVGLLVFYYMVV